MSNSGEAFSERRELVVVTEYCLDRPYLELKVPEDLGQAQSVTFIVSSRDQGWTSENNDFASWTWFQATVHRPHGRNNIAPTTLFNNRKANPEFFEHTIKLSAEQVKALKPGDVVGLLPRAMYACWLNIIQYARIELRYQKQSLDVLLSPIVCNVNQGLYARKLIGAELRVLPVLPGPAESPIRCELNYIKMEANDAYDALSYCWGDDRATSEIEVRLDSGFQNVYITRSVHDALTYLRGSEPLTLWVDAICINQNDDVEKAQQVNMMASIFASARTVHVWLGTDQAIQFALSIIRDIYNTVEEACTGGELCSCRGTQHNKTSDFELEQDFPDANAKRNDVVMKVYDTHRKWSRGKLEEFSGGFSNHVSILMSHLFENAWFRRVWVLQEVKRASDVLVHCARTTITWNELEMVSQWMDAQTFTLLLPNVHVGLTTIPQVWRTLSPDNSSDILPVVLSSLDLKATDGRDKIFAVSSFSRETSQNPDSLIKPNYKKDVALVFADFTRWWIIEHKSLAILSYIHGHRSRTWLRVTCDRDAPISSPSWAFPQDGKPSWGEATLENLCSHRASADTTVDLTGLQNQKPEDWKTLKLLGHRVASIETIACLKFEGTLAEDENYSQLLDAMHSVIDPASLVENWKTRKVVGGEARRNAGMRYNLHLQGHDEFEVNRSFISMVGSETGEGQALAGDCADPFCFKTTNDMYGLCPWRAQSGDIVVILLGGNVPFLLRKSGEDFELVGECFVMGIMDGQFMEDMQKQSKKPELFSLI